jgi:hypothetical protein
MCSCAFYQRLSYRSTLACNLDLWLSVEACCNWWSHASREIHKHHDADHEDIWCKLLDHACSHLFVTTRMQDKHHWSKRILPGEATSSVHMQRLQISIYIVMIFCEWIQSCSWLPLSTYWTLVGSGTQYGVIYLGEFANKYQAIKTSSNDSLD